MQFYHITLQLKLIIITTLFTKILGQYCSKKCNCYTQNFTLTSCPPIKITHLTIELDKDFIVISCRNPALSNFEIVPRFDAHYLTSIDDKSLLTLNFMINRCAQTRAKEIVYVLNSDRFKELVASNTSLSQYNSIEYFRFVRKSENINISLFETDFLADGSHLQTMTVNNLNIPRLQGSYFSHFTKIEAINLASNNIKAIDNNTFVNQINLKSIDLQNNKLVLLTQETFNGLRNVTSMDLSRNNLNLLKEGIFSSMKQIVYLNVSKNNLESIDNSTFRALVQLEHLDLSQNANLTLQSNIFANLTALKFLNISGCSLASIPINFLQSSNKLEILNISGNSITHLEDTTFKNLTELKIIDLSYNSISILPKDLLQPLKNLQQIFISFNKLTVFNSKVFWSVHNLRTIDLSHNLIREFFNSLGQFRANDILLDHNEIDRFPSFLLNVVELKHLDLSFNKIKSVELMREIIPKTANIEIFLNNNQISKYNVTNLENYDFENSKNKHWKITMDLSKNRLECDCLKYKLKTVPQSGNQTVIFELTNKENICYDRFPHDSCPIIHVSRCPAACNCHYTRIYNAIIVDCAQRNIEEYPEIHGLQTDLYQPNQTFVNLSGNMLNINGQERFQRYDNVSRLDLSYNWIETIDELPKNLEELKLDNNRLSLLTAKNIKQLRNNKALRVISLRNNLWACDCRANDLKNYLIEYNNIKIEPSQVVCETTGEQLIYAKVCETQRVLNWALPTGLIIIALILAALAVYYKFNTSIKIYLYSKNLCLWCVAEEEIDKEKTYDIFISFSHKDESFVSDTLLPELESGERPFKVCIHYRDWLPGELINTNIISSVLDSRRTLVVLSNNFMESVWGKMEFRTAHLQAINEGMARVIVVLYGDLDESILDDEMKMYLKTNTYVKWGDPWFWSKLKYALPHSKLMRKRHISRESRESFHLS